MLGKVDLCMLHDLSSFLALKMLAFLRGLCGKLKCKQRQRCLLRVTTPHLDVHGGTCNIYLAFHTGRIADVFAAS